MLIMVIFVSRVVTYGDFIDLVIFSISNQSEKLMEKLDDLNCNLAPIIEIFFVSKINEFSIPKLFYDESNNFFGHKLFARTMIKL